MLLVEALSSYGISVFSLYCTCLPNSADSKLVCHSSSVIPSAIVCLLLVATANGSD